MYMTLSALGDRAQGDDSAARHDLVGHCSILCHDCIAFNLLAAVGAPMGSNVIDYGAKGDGKTLDTAAIQHTVKRFRP